MYQLTPPNIRNNPMPYFKLQEWGLEQSMIDAIEEQSILLITVKMTTHQYVVQTLIGLILVCNQTFMHY